MEEFLKEVIKYSDSIGVSPSTIIQRAGVRSGNTWKRWSEGRGSPTLATADRLRTYIAENPPKEGQDA